MAKTFTVTVGPRAYSFHDQSTGITISRGEAKELTSRQFNSKKIQLALASGHLTLVVDKNTQHSKYTDDQIEKLAKKLQAQIAKGMTVEKIAKGYSLEEVKLIAKKYGFEIEDTDTAESLIQAIIEDEDSESHKEEE